MRLAFVGLPRTGKDTAGKYLTDKFFFQRLAFGDFMKTKYYMENPEMLNLPKDREHMIAWSQPKVEKDNRIWIRYVEDYMSRALRDGKHDFVITDLRQPHEEQWARENGFKLVRIVSNSKVAQERADKLGEKIGVDLDTSSIKHDFVVFNNGNLAELYKQLDDIVYYGI